MYLLAKFGDYRPYRDEDINSYINSYMDDFEEARLTDLFRHKAFYILCNNWKQASRDFISPIQKGSSVKMLFWKWEPLASKGKVRKIADLRAETLLKPELRVAIFLWISQSILGHFGVAVNSCLQIFFFMIIYCCYLMMPFLKPLSFASFMMMMINFNTIISEIFSI